MMEIPAVLVDVHIEVIGTMVASVLVCADMDASVGLLYVETVVFIKDVWIMTSAVPITGFSLSLVLMLCLFLVPVLAANRQSNTIYYTTYCNRFYILKLLCLLFHLCGDVVYIIM